MQLFPSYGVAEAEAFETVEELVCDADGEFLGEELKLVSGGLVDKEEIQRNLSGEGLEDLDEILPEAFVELGGLDVDYDL